MAVEFEFDPEKNALLKEERGIGFEDIIALMADGFLLDVVAHPNKKKYAHQQLYVVDVEGYLYLVPFVRDKDRIFLKTIYPSRKATRKYLEEKKG